MLNVSFKPYYKWNTFNTNRENNQGYTVIVLNLIINGIPSIPASLEKYELERAVLNLIINGIPSIQI